MAIIREKEKYKAMRKKTNKNLFEPNHHYNLRPTQMKEEGMKWAMNDTLRTTTMLNIGRYVAKWKAS